LIAVRLRTGLKPCPYALELSRGKGRAEVCLPVARPRSYACPSATSLGVVRLAGRQGLEGQVRPHEGAGERVRVEAAAQADQLVGDGGDDRDEGDARDDPQPEVRRAQGREHDHGDDDHHEQEAGAAANVGGGVALDGRRLQRVAGLKGVDTLVLGAVVGVYAPDIRDQPDESDIRQEYREPDQAFDGDDKEGALDHVIEPAGQQHRPGEEEDGDQGERRQAHAGD